MSYPRRLVLAAAVACALAAAGAAAVVYTVLPQAILRPARLERLLVYHGRTPAALGLRAEPFSVDTDPGMTIRGWLVLPPPAAPPRAATLVLLHGHSSCKEALLGAAAEWGALGYRCVLYDSRAHGESGGKYCTFGYYERRDFSRVLDALETRHGPLGPVGVWGNSLGGAVALQAMAEDGRVRCAVVESVFAELREIVADDCALYTGMQARWLTDFALARAGRLAGFPALGISPAAAAARIDRPVLVVHGAADARTACAYGERIFRVLQTHVRVGAEWLPIADGGHLDLARAGGSDYRARLPAFFDRHLR